MNRDFVKIDFEKKKCLYLLTYEKDRYSIYDEFKTLFIRKVIGLMN